MHRDRCGSCHCRLRSSIDVRLCCKTVVSPPGQAKHKRDHTRCRERSRSGFFVFLITSMFSSYRLSIWFAIYISAVALTQLLGAKTIPLHIRGIPIFASASLVLIPCVLMMVDAVLETYGRKYANSMICASVCTVVFTACASALMIALPAATSFVPEQRSYTHVFGGSFRFACTSALSFALFQLLDVYSLTRWRYTCGALPLWARLFLAAAFALAVDTFVFTLVDHVNIHQPVMEQLALVLRIAIPYWMTRTLVACLGIPLVYFGIPFLRPRNLC